LDPISEPAKMSNTKQPVMKLICNAHAWGGGERSAAWLATRMLQEGYEVQLLPTKGINDNFRKTLSPYVRISSPDSLLSLTEPCDLMVVYTNDMVFGFQNNPQFAKLENVQAKRKVMVLNYRLGAAGKLDWTKSWDKYIFLCSDMEEKFKGMVPDANTVVLPPPVDLKPFLDTNLGSLNRTLHVVRVSSQTSQKMPANIREIVQRIKSVHPSVTFTFMGGHPALDDLDYVENVKEFSKPVIDILRKGCVFWYMLPYEPTRYLDNGPRVIMEAMAAGLPVIADNWGGAKDRITDDTGWLCDSLEEHIKVFTNVDGRTLNIKGQAAKERARNDFNPDKWIEAIKDG
jgi:glycosyltransferase involved in cell wall biosynthesis